MLTLPYVGLDEINNARIGTLKALFAEFLGTGLLVLVGCGSCRGTVDVVKIALCFGITVATLAQTLGHVSGCHINPAVTSGLVTGGKIGLVKGLLYVVAQCLGAVVGASMLCVLLPADESAFFKADSVTCVGCSAVGSISPGQAFGVEFFITMVLVLVVFAAAADENNAGSVRGSAALAIGLSITACHLFAIELTGSSMNPARTFGPSAINNMWANHWVYWLGPILGGVTAAIIYQLILKAPETYKGVATVDNP